MAPSVSLPVSPFGRFIDKLIKRRIHIVCELNLCNRLHPLRSASNCKAHDSLFAQGRIEHSFGAEFSSEIHTTAEDAPEGDVFAKHQRAFIGTEGMFEGAIDGLKEVLASERGTLRVRHIGTERRWTVVEERMGGVVYWDVQTCVWRESRVAPGRGSMSFVPP